MGESSARKGRMGSSIGKAGWGKQYKERQDGESGIGKSGWRKQYGKVRMGKAA